MAISKHGVCPYCLRNLRMGYPGGDPENGPATLSCPTEECEVKREVDDCFRFKMTATLDESRNEAEYEDSWFHHADEADYRELEFEQI